MKPKESEPLQLMTSDVGDTCGSVGSSIFDTKDSVAPSESQLEQSDSLEWAEPRSSTTVAQLCDQVSLLSCPSLSATCVSAESSMTVLELLKPCTLWACPIDADLKKTDELSRECPICLLHVSPAAMLPCAMCHCDACIYCHLRSLAGREYQCRHDALLLHASCAFCRAPYSMQQLRQLHLIYRAHKGQLHFPLWNVGDDDSPDQRSVLLQEMHHDRNNQSNDSQTVQSATPASVTATSGHETDASDVSTCTHSSATSCTSHHQPASIANTQVHRLMHSVQSNLKSVTQQLDIIKDMLID